MENEASACLLKCLAVKRRRSQGVLLANLVFQGCSLDTKDASIVEVDGCLPDSPSGKIRLHHVAFRRNVLNGASGLSMSSASCSSLEMRNVTFSDNVCRDRCFARLALENDLRGLTMRRNVQSSKGSPPSALMSSPSGSSTLIADLSSSLNELTILRVVKGRLEMKGAKIRATRQSSLLLDHARVVIVADSLFDKNFALLSGAAIMSNATESLTVSHCEFASSTAENGAAIASFGGNLTVDNCSFKHNVAIGDAGSLLVSNGTLELFSSFFRNNNAAGSGGAILLTASSSTRLSGMRCDNNTAKNGGCLQISASKDLVVHRCAFAGNNASNDGGGAVILEESSVHLDEVIWSENIAQLEGGGILIKKSTVTSHRCKYLKNEATHGAGSRIVDGKASMDSDSLVRNEAQIGGGGVSALDGTTDLRNCVASKNTGRYGGGLNIMRTVTAIHNTTFRRNTARMERGGGLACRLSEVEVVDSSFLANHAVGIGGGFDLAVCNLMASNLTIRDNHAERAGGINCSGGTLFNLSGSIVRSNVAVDGGGLVVQGGSVAQLSTCLVKSNTASNAGGIGVYING